MNEIILFPVSGLGNRIASIEAAIRLAEKNNFDKIVILWDQTTVPCCFKSLLDVYSDECKIEIKAIPGGNKNNIFSRLIHGIVLRFYTLGAYKSIPLLDGSDHGRMEIDAFPKRGKIYIKACNEFYPFKRIEHVKFNKEDEKKADSYLPKNRRIVGVHIRRGDNYNSTSESKTELFIERMQEVIKEDKDVAFFLATDDLKLQEKLLEQFGEHVFIQSNKTGERFSVRGQHEAAIDMIALSKSEYIIGSYYSSFTDMAAKYGGINVEVIKKG